MFYLQPIHADEKLLVFVLRASRLGLISSMRLVGRKAVQSIISALLFCIQSLKLELSYQLSLGNIKYEK